MEHRATVCKILLACFSHSGSMAS